MTFEERRRTPRYPADWSANYQLEDDADWRACRVVGASRDGAAIELHGLRPDEQFSGRLILELSSSSGEPPVKLRAIIRHGARMPSGQTLVGVEFVLMTRRQSELLDLLVRLRATV